MSDSLIYVAGHSGLVGSAIIRNLKKSGRENLIFRKQSELNLLDQRATQKFFRSNSIQEVYLAAAKVGGIHANQTYPADFLYENLMIACNVIHAAAETGVSKLLYLGSSCIYPREAPQPLKEEYLLTSQLEPTNEGYALAKIAGLKLAEKFNLQYGKNFISAMPTNLYGEGDNFHPENSHVIPGMLRRFHEAKTNGAHEVVIWGTGSPKREFLYSDDLARALILIMDKYNDSETINVGTGEDITILGLAETIKKVVGYEGKITTDPTKPDGTPRKVLDISKLKSLGWNPALSLEEGLQKAYAWALDQGVFN